MRLNLNETVKVKLTERGKEIYRQYFSPLPDGFEQPEPRINEDGFTKLQLWMFMEMFGEHMSIWQPNVIEPFEIVFDNGEEIVYCKDCKHYNFETHGCKRNPSVEGWKHDDYCSYGERKLKKPDDSLVSEDSEDVKEQESKLESDLISRQAAIEALETMRHIWARHIRTIESLPPVTHDKRTETHGVCSDIISRQAAIEAVEKAVFKGVAKSAIESLPPVEPERKWTPCSNPPKHHGDVLVRGIEAIGNVKVHKVMQWDVDRWRPMDYSSSVTWEEWSEI